MRSLKVRAYAKLNLYLDITGRRADGYHELKTVMQSIDLCDELTFTLSDGAGIELRCKRPDVPTDESNLVWKGISAVLSYAYFQPGCRITAEIKKNIPSGAGMGGGSADCAAAILAMNELFHLGLSAEELITAGKMCGADVPFCITGGTALCEGIGEVMTPLETPKDICFAVVKPDEGISTPAAYKAFDSRGTFSGGDYERFSEALSDGSARAIGGALYNAFTNADEPAFIADAKSALIRAGAYGAEMTGSGSAVFGVFDDEAKAKAAAESAELPFYGVYRPIAAIRN